MKVADLMFNNRPDKAMGLVAEERSPGGSTAAEPRIFTVSLIMNPAEVEVIDGALVFEKRVLATNAQDAMTRAGVRAKM